LIVRVRSKYKGVSFEVELSARDLESLEYLKGIIGAIHEFIDEITKRKEVDEHGQERCSQA